MDLSPRSIENQWRHLGELYTCRDTVMWHLSADTFFDSCQLTIAWTSISKFSVYALDSQRVSVTLTMTLTE